ncbi:MAG: phenylacetate--CoA ligase [Proteobacteria bacterium]|nr:phenylacetate--CoA ligase [Pseudomonadota bacterium]
MDIWDPQKESMKRDEIEQLQLERLQATLNRVYKNVRHYKTSFSDIDFMPEDLQSLTDFNKLPFTTRQDLRDDYPYGMFAVTLREVVRLHAPSLGFEKPVVLGFTKNDLNCWVELMARCLSGVGVTKDDVVQISMPTWKILNTFGIQRGAELIGASVLPVSIKNLPNQVKIMRDFRTTILVTTPGFAMGLINAISSSGIDMITLSLKQGIIGSEAWSENTRNLIEKNLHITATDIYSLTEIFGPGVAWECHEKNGLHISEDHFLPEIIDPVTLEPLPPGAEGELVITTLTKEAFPLVRFRTGDLTSLNYTPCGCGRTHARISRISKRTDDVFVMNATCVIPDQINMIITKLNNGKEPVFQLQAERKKDRDTLTVIIEVTDTMFFDEIKKQLLIVDDIQLAISEFLGWNVHVKFVEQGSIDRKKQVLDNRSL